VANTGLISEERKRVKNESVTALKGQEFRSFLKSVHKELESVRKWIGKEGGR
jgi:hypothetical protein